VDIRQLRYLQCIVDARSFTRAASTLHIAQPALTLQVQKLEQELGVQLLVRHARGVEPTSAGQLLLRRAKQILDDVESTKALFRNSAGASEKILVLGILPMADIGLTASIAQRLADEFPDAEINMVEAIGPTVVEAVLNGRVAAGLVHHMEALPIGVVGEELHHEPFVFVESARSKHGSGGEIALAEAIRRPLILPPAPHPLRTIVERTAKQHGITLSVPIELHSLAGRIELVERNYGCSLLPQQEIADRIDAGDLIGLTVHSPTLTRITSLVYPVRKSYAPLEARAREILRSVYTSWITPAAAQQEAGQT
jgi:LysR family nitrogen assimilation transcriptional regulator